MINKETIKHNFRQTASFPALCVRQTKKMDKDMKRRHVPTELRNDSFYRQNHKVTFVSDVVFCGLRFSKIMIILITLIDSIAHKLAVFSTYLVPQSYRLYGTQTCSVQHVSRPIVLSTLWHRNLSRPIALSTLWHRNLQCLARIQTHSLNFQHTLKVL